MGSREPLYCIPNEHSRYSLDHSLRSERTARGCAGLKSNLLAGGPESLDADLLLWDSQRREQCRRLVSKAG